MSASVDQTWLVEASIQTVFLSVIIEPFLYSIDLHAHTFAAQNGTEYPILEHDDQSKRRVGCGGGGY